MIDIFDQIKAKKVHLRPTISNNILSKYFPFSFGCTSVSSIVYWEIKYYELSNQLGSSLFSAWGNRCPFKYDVSSISIEFCFDTSFRRLGHLWYFFFLWYFAGYWFISVSLTRLGIVTRLTRRGLFCFCPVTQRSRKIT